MKSRKKVSRKKTARHKTSTRRSSGRRSIRNRNKSRRGGMLRSARAVAGTLLYHDILPLLSRARLNIQLGREPTPDEYAITKENDRYYGTILDIPADDGIKTSIEELRKELENPVKTADKMKSINEKYDTIMKKLEEEKKRQTKEMMVVGTSAFKPNHTEPENTKAYFLNVGLGAGAGAGAGAGSYRFDQFVSTPLIFSPDPKRYPVYSTETGTPQKPPPKSETRPQNVSLAIIGTPLRPLELDKSKTSPNSPPPLSVREKKSNFLLSPSPGPYKQLKFDDATTLQP